jgi:2-oxoglutarate/2-oxoacid ferredoxin oxidoreductase subunit alpha
LTPPSVEAAGRPVEQTESVVVRFAGDSGDGVQVTGSQFTRTSALVGNDIATLPNFPAEIRAPTGTLFGVSGFQIQLGAVAIRTPGDTPDALVAFNPAALKVNLDELKKGGLVLVNSAAFSKRNLDKAGYESNPLEDGSLAGFQLVTVDMTTMTRNALVDSPLKTKDKDRSKNFFALGMVYYLYGRPLDHTIEWIEGKFGKKPEVAAANVKALKTGFNYAMTAEVFVSTYAIPEAPIAPGKYRRVTGNLATALGLVAASQKAGLNLFLGSYPITPASDLLHNLASFRAHGVKTLQAEDEIAAICAALGASYAGSLGVCSTSGPGLALKGEALGLAMMIELPMVVVDVQRGGPSTGLPTKTEQSDYNIAVYGRNGDAPLPVIAARSPADCFDAAYEAARITVKYRTPVVLMTDGYLANGSEPWPVPDADSLQPFQPNFLTAPEDFQPYSRDEDTLARPWVRPGTPNLEHRVGGLEKADLTGNVSYDPANHQRMCQLRADKVDRVRQEMAPLSIVGDRSGDVLVIGWGSTWGAITSAVKAARADGKNVSSVHLRWLFPLHEDLGDLIAGFDKILVPEMNMGQLIRTIRGEFLVDAKGLNQVTGLPINVSTVLKAIDDLMYGEA